MAGGAAAGPDVQALVDELARLQAKVAQVQAQQQQQDIFDNPMAGSEAAAAASVTALKGAAETTQGSQIAPLGAPRSLHPVGVIICLDPNVSSTRRNLYLVGCIAVTCLQTMCVQTVYKGTSEPSCSHFHDCPAGYFCAANEPSASAKGECRGCLDPSYDIAVGQFTWFCVADDDGSEVCEPLWSNATAFCALDNLTEYRNGLAGCAACFDPTLPDHLDTWNTGKTEVQVVVDNLNRMRGSDYVALLIVSYVVGLYASGEYADIKLCDFLAEQRLAAAAETTGPTAPRWVYRVFWALQSTRQFGFLLLLSATVPQLVAHRGSASLEICFNGVAILFLMELECVCLLVHKRDGY